MESKTIVQCALKYEEPGIQARAVSQNPHFAIIHMELGPKAHLKPHQTPFHVQFVILRGQATIQIGDNEETFAPNTVIESPANIMHGVRNATDETIELFVIKHIIQNSLQEALS